MVVATVDDKFYGTGRFKGVCFALSLRQLKYNLGQSHHSGNYNIGNYKNTFTKLNFSDISFWYWEQEFITFKFANCKTLCSYLSKSGGECFEAKYICLTDLVYAERHLCRKQKLKKGKHL